MRLLLIAIAFTVASSSNPDQFVESTDTVEPIRRSNSGSCGARGKPACADGQCDLGLRLRGRARKCNDIEDPSLGGGSGSFVQKCDGIQTSDWSPSISNPRADGCTPVLVNTHGKSCAEFCASKGLGCVRAQDNVGSGCGLDGRHTRQTLSNSGCDQKWNNQVCVCAQMVCRACGRGGNKQPPCLVDGEETCDFGRVPNAAGTLCPRCGGNGKKPCQPGDVCNSLHELTLTANDCDSLGTKCYESDDFSSFDAANQPPASAGTAACHVLAQTKGQTCKQWCEARGKVCVRGQDNVGNTCNLDSRTDRQKIPGTNDPKDGCNQSWNNQVCGCAENTCKRIRCGRRNQPPCSDGNCNPGLTPVTSGSATTCQRCGRPNQPSCGGECNTGLRESNEGKCEPCGAQGQRACPGAVSCDPELVVDNNDMCVDPTEAPTEAPTASPTEAPTASPTEAPTASPTASPTEAPTTDSPTEAPTEAGPTVHDLLDGCWDFQANPQYARRIHYASSDIGGSGSDYSLNVWVRNTWPAASALGAPATRYFQHSPPVHGPPEVSYLRKAASASFELLSNRVEFATPIIDAVGHSIPATPKTVSVDTIENPGANPGGGDWARTPAHNTMFMLTYSVSSSGMATAFITTEDGNRYKMWEYDINAQGGAVTFTEGDFVIGGGRGFAGLDDPALDFNGVMCNFKWFPDTALTESDIDDLFAAGYDETNLQKSYDHPNGQFRGLDDPRTMSDNPVNCHVDRRCCKDAECTEWREGTNSGSGCGSGAYCDASTGEYLGPLAGDAKCGPTLSNCP